MALPNLFVIGAMKAGTTTVYHTLRQHPQIFMSPVKEPQFFIEEPEGGWQGPDAHNTQRRTRAEYAALFDDAGDASIRGEASPVYLCDPGAMARIHDQVPDARIVAILRHPVDRAYSAYLMKRRHGYERLEFDAALAEESRRISQGWRYAWHYAALGRYHVQLERVYAHFSPAQVRVVFYDDLANDPVSFMRDLYRFLSVDDRFVARAAVDRNPGFAVRHSGMFRWLTTPSRVRGWAKAVLPARTKSLWTPVARAARAMNARPAPALDPEHRRRLTRLWASDIETLERMTGRSLSHWLA
jgi:hypothetical protein